MLVFQISGCLKNDRHSVLKTLLDFADPIKFTAIHFKQIEDTDCEFLAKDCLELLMKIIAHKFEVPLPENSNHFVSLT